MDIKSLLESFDLSTKNGVETAMDLIMSKEIQIMNSLENNSLSEEIVNNLLKDKELLSVKYYELSKTLNNMSENLPDEPENGDVEA